MAFRLATTTVLCHWLEDKTCMYCRQQTDRAEFRADGRAHAILNIYRKEPCPMDLANFPRDTHQCCAPLGFKTNHLELLKQFKEPTFKDARSTSPEWIIQNVSVVKVGGK